MRKSKFWNFWFSFVPGCGQLYLGATHKGVILLSLFFGIMALEMIIRLDFLLFALPVIWFYAFFDALNSVSLTQEEIVNIDREFADKFYKLFNGKSLFSKKHMVIGILLIFVGIYMLLYNFVLPIFKDIAWIRSIIHDIPTVFVSFVIISLGVYLIYGKKENKPDFIEYKGGEHDGEQK